MFNPVLYAQNRIERQLADAGFENVRFFETDSISYIFVDGRSFRSREVNLEIISREIRDLSGYIPHDKVSVVFTYDREPQLVLSSVKDSVGEFSGNIGSWNINYETKNAVNIIKHLDVVGRAGSKFYNNSAGKIDFIIYPEFHFRNVRLDIMYQTQLNISPAIEINLWRGSKFTGQIIFPIINEYEREYDQVRPGFVNLSQDFKIPGNIFARATIGSFNTERLGADIKVYKPFGQRWGIYAEAGITGRILYYYSGWRHTPIKKFTGSLGGNYFIDCFDLMLDARVARFLGKDIGVEGKITRYFKWAVMGFYLQKTEKVNYNGGFYFSIAIPPYRQKRKKYIRVSPLPYYELVYNAQARQLEGRSYLTSPNETNAENFFNILRFGQIIRNY
ncbi:MAG: YjbH domain-containing protein [Rikenellaceae bacterium]|nr:YjbH domain-containing protein [Rikenellaceae bacterium]